MEQNIFAKTFASLTKRSLPIVIGASLLLADPFPSEAARSGSRSGGSSFRSAPRSSYSAPRSSTRLGGSTTFAPPRTNNIIIAPSMGYGYSPFGFGGGFGFGYMPFFMSPNLLVPLLFAYLAFNVLSNRVGGSSFSDDGDDVMSSLGSGATLLKIQVSLDDDWSKSGNIMDTLAKISSKESDLSSRRQLSRLLSDTSLALLRKSGDWNAVAYKGDLFRSSNKELEPAFQKLAISERSKFEQEVVDNNSYSGAVSRPTQVVVSLVVALRGRAQAYSERITSTKMLRECLQNLAADALTDDGNNIMAVELLWTPSEPGLTISERELIEDYPELLKL